MIIVHFIFFILIMLSIIGYGYFLLKLSRINHKVTSLGYIGLSGIFLINIYSYLLTFFSSHTKFSNITILLLGLFFFFYFFKKKNLYSNSIYFILVSIFFIGVLIGKPHDDFEYYHFPYTLNLIQSDPIYGIGNLNHGFRTPSSIFYLNSVFYLPFIEYYSFSYGSIYYMIFANFILIDYLKTDYINKNLFFSYFTIFTLLFINIFFYRIGEHGTDRSAQILIFILILELFIFLNIKRNVTYQVSILTILISLIISLKAFYLIYLIFLIIIFYHLIKNEKMKISEVSKIIFRNLFVIFAIVNIFLILLTYFKNTGCLLYPLPITCFDYFSWAISKEEVLEMSQWYELWSKGGAAPNFRVKNPEEYLIGFNWVKNWIDIYFFNKISDFILGLTTMSLIIFFSLKKTNRYAFKNIKFKSITIITIILLLEWFYNHPSLRYGGYCLIAILFAFLISYRLSSYNQKFSDIKKNIFVLFIISLVIFIGRNSNRINKEYNLYNYNPLINSNYKLNKSHFRINDKIVNLKNCYYKKSNCKYDDRFSITKNNKNWFIQKND